MQRDIDQINVIPLVDVMLVLLVIVLTTATFIAADRFRSIWQKRKKSGIARKRPS